MEQTGDLIPATNYLTHCNYLLTYLPFTEEENAYDYVMLDCLFLSCDRDNFHHCLTKQCGGYKMLVLIKLNFSRLLLIAVRGWFLIFFVVMLIFICLSSTFLLLCAVIVMKRVKVGPKLTMGSWLSYFWWGGDPDEVNPVSGLTRRDIYAVQKSWAPVYANAVATGSELLRRLFRTYPETKEFFKMVRKLPEEEYMNNPQFKAHVMNLMTSLNLAVNNLHQPEIVAAMMNKLGDSHKKRQIKEKHFHELKDVIVTMFIEVLHLEGATLASWGKTVEFWYKHIFETLNAAEETR